MDLKQVLQGISAGILVTDAEFKVVWANEFEEKYYGMSLEDMVGIWVVDCHKEENREKIHDFLLKFKNGEMNQFSKTANGMVFTYDAYYKENTFAGIVRTRIKM